MRRISAVEYLQGGGLFWFLTQTSTSSGEMTQCFYFFLLFETEIICDFAHVPLVSLLVCVQLTGAHFEGFGKKLQTVSIVQQQ